MIMLLLLTMIVTSAFTLGGTNLKSVTNMQGRNEATAAANAAIEQVISSPFYTAPAAQSINIDINGDGVTDYVVNIGTPMCMSASSISSAMVPPTDPNVPIPPSITDYDTVWDLSATVTDPVTGASVQVHQGVRVLLDQTQYQLVCS